MKSLPSLSRPNPSHVLVAVTESCNSVLCSHSLLSAWASGSSRKNSESLSLVPVCPGKHDYHPDWSSPPMLVPQCLSPRLQTQSTMQACARHPSHPLLHFEPSPSQDLKMQVTSYLSNLCHFPDSQGKSCIFNSPCSALYLWPRLPPIFPFLVYLCLLTRAVSFCTLACLVA